MSKVVEQDALALRYASDDLRSDRELSLHAVRMDGLALEHVKPEFIDRKLALAAVSQNGLALRFCSDMQRANAEIVGLAFRENKRSIRYARMEHLHDLSDGLSYVDAVNLAIQEDGRLLLDFPDFRLWSFESLVQIFFEEGTFEDVEDEISSACRRVAGHLNVHDAGSLFKRLLGFLGERFDWPSDYFQSGHDCFRDYLDFSEFVVFWELYSHLDLKAKCDHDVLEAFIQCCFVSASTREFSSFFDGEDGDGFVCLLEAAKSQKLEGVFLKALLKYAPEELTRIDEASLLDMVDAPDKWKEVVQCCGSVFQLAPTSIRDDDDVLRKVLRLGLWHFGMLPRDYRSNKSLALRA